MSKLKYWLEVFLSYIPTKLPVAGMTEFTSWQDSILRLANVPDNDSTRFASAVMIMHLGATEVWKPKQFFVRSLEKSAANEIANAVCMGLKEKQKARMLAEEEAKAKAAMQEANNVPVQQSQVQ